MSIIGAGAREQVVVEDGEDDKVAFEVALSADESEAKGSGYPG